VKRRQALISIFGGAAIPATSQAQQSALRPFYITGLYHSKEFNDCTVPPIKVYARNITEALLNIPGVAVWEEHEIPEEFRKFPPAWCAK